MKRRTLFATVLALSLAPLSGWADGPTPKDAETLVREAAAFQKANGRDKLIQAVNVKNGAFHKGELYVFVYDDKATILAHPINPKLIGRSTYDTPDADGKFYRKDIVELAKTKGNGWVDYKYKNPESGKVEAKTSFVLASDGLILVAGIYKN